MKTKIGNLKFAVLDSLKLTSTIVCGWSIDSIPILLEEGYLLIKVKDKPNLINVKR